MIPAGVPANVVVLAIDPAASSGYALRVGRGVLTVSTAKSALERRDVVARAIEEATSQALRLAVVMERWTVGGGKRWTPPTMIGMGDARGRWREHLDLAKLPHSRLIQCTPAEWRAPFFGRLRLRREAFKSQAKLAAAALGWKLESDDEAEAFLISQWAVYHCDAVKRLASLRGSGV